MWKDIRGQKTKLLGKVGDFEVEAKWSWKLQVNPLNVLLIASSLLVVMLSILGCAYLYMLSRELSKFTSEAAEGLKELKELKDRVAELTTWQSAISEEMKELREHSEPATNQSESGRFRRSVLGRVQAVHLERGVEYTETDSNGIIRNWNVQKWLDQNYLLDNYELENRDSSLVVPCTGLYLIYAQLCYAAARDNNSFQVRLMSEGRSDTEARIVAQCSAGTSTVEDEVTCYTSVVQVLQAGDRIYLKQTQKYRKLHMNLSRSFMGIVRLTV